MKTKNNAQETVFSQVRKMVLRGSAVIICLVLISWSVGAQNFWEEVFSGYNNNKMAMSGIENPNVIKDAETTIEANNVEDAAQTNNFAETSYEAIEEELKFQVEEYIAADFVEAELATETESLTNSNSESNSEAIESSLELQVEEYNAADFVEDELSLETESWMNSSSGTNYEATETELELQIEGYNAADFVEAELSGDTESWANNNAEINYEAIETELELQVGDYSAAKFVEAELATEAIEAELAPQIDTLMNVSKYKSENFVSAEMALEIEAQKANNEFLIKAANETAMEADQQVEKYAMHLICHAKNGTKQ